MQERPQNISAVDDESEATLVAPRFDAEEARRAHPVVPLEEARARTPFFSPHRRERRSLRRSWPTALLAVALFAVVAVGGALATKVLHRPHANTPTQAEASPAPAQTPDAQPQQPQPQEASPAPRAPREEARVKRPPRSSHEARERENVEGMVLAPAEVLRGGAEESDDKDEERRVRDREREKHRERERDDADKEMRKALKHVKGKVPRLVDVLTGPEQ